MHTTETQYFRSEDEAKTFLKRIKDPSNDVFVKLGPVLADGVVFTEPDGTKTPAWVVKYEEYV